MVKHGAVQSREAPVSIAVGDAVKCDIVRSAIRGGYLGDNREIVSFVVPASIVRTIRSLHEAFPKHFRHTFAAKANTMRRALELVRGAGMGCEVASPGELEQAIRAGFEAGDIVYDEPTKTRRVLEKALAMGISLNIDNFQEFERVAALVKRIKSRSRIGFRINPQVGAGSITAMSTATETSKFGTALEDDGSRDRLLETYLANDWLSSVHTHIGSQGCDMPLMIAGIRKLVDFAKTVNAAAGRQRIAVIDIGGGLPVNFRSEEVTPTFDDYASRLKAEVPELFTGEFVVKTEFGRSIFAKNGFIAAKVEYTKTSGGRRIAISHAGAQIATRTVFMPELWALRISVLDAAGNAKTGPKEIQNIAGPCCFAGDLVAQERLLPVMEPGDIVVLHDTGAYYFSNPFFYNSLPASAVLGADLTADGSVRFDVWREQQSCDDILAVLG